MQTSKQIREYFVSDTGLPIQILDDPYFEYYLKLFDPYYESIDKYTLFMNTINKLGGEHNLIEESKRFRNNMIHCIETNIDYKHFVTDPLKFDPVVPLEKGNLYQESNANIQFASIDLVEANFQSLRYVNPMIVFGYKYYKNLAETMTTFEYFVQNKKIRQIIFGSLNPSRQQTVQKYIISIIKKYLLERIHDTSIKSTSSDEIVFRTNYSADTIRKLVGFDKSVIPNIEDVRIKVNVFKLLLEGTEKYKFFIKLYEDGHKEIKQVDSAYMPEIIKFLEKREIIDFDRFFCRDGRLCQFKDSLFSQNL